MKRIFLAILLLSMGILAATTHETSSKENDSKNKLPRFVSLRFSPVNARSGPGEKYPIEWVYMQQSAPVEVIAEYEKWRRIRDWQGSESWINSKMLTSTRHVKVITPGENNLYAKSNTKSRIIARIEDDVIGKVEKCPADNNFCLLKFDTIKGWMPRQNLYGLYPEEIID